MLSKTEDVHIVAVALGNKLESLTEAERCALLIDLSGKFD